MKLILLFTVFYSFGPLAKIQEFKIIGSVDQKFEFSKVCAFKGINPAPIIEVKNSISLDCMGMIVNTSEFCQNHSKDNLIKSFVDRQNEKVVCQTGKGAKLKILCDKKHKGLCVSKEKGCARIHKILAKEIPLVHSSITSENGIKVLNCYFLNGESTDYF